MWLRRIRSVANPTPQSGNDQLASEGRGLGSGVTNDFDFCEERKKDGLEHATNGGVRIAQRLEMRVRE